jgi:cytochrome c
MDKMTVNMIAGAVLSSLLVLFGTSTFINIVYPTGGAPEPEAEGAAHGGAPAGGGTTAPAEAGKPIGVLLASADPKAGEVSAKKCATCHTFEAGGPNKVGPNLHGIVGRPVGKHEGFSYSPATGGHGGNWDYELLNCYLADPKACIPGNKMAFAGLKKDTERADVIAYLRTITDNPPPLPAAAEAQPAQGVAPPAAGGPPPAKAQEKPSPAPGGTAPGQPASQNPVQPGEASTGSAPANR